MHVGAPGLPDSDRISAARSVQITYLEGAHRLQDTVPTSSHLHRTHTHPRFKVLFVKSKRDILAAMS
jgi:hypothetical protein